MLSFTEFFTKKKIDINALEKAQPDLYQEFDRDYALMGEKSFDHSKKFWFNRLRKEYLLEEMEIPVAKVPEIKITKEDIKKEASVESRPTGFKPKFKPKSVTSIEEKAETSTEEKTATSAAPSGFKPRFKASNLPKKSEEDEVVKGDVTSPQTSNSPEVSESLKADKPKGFTPRFKASNLPKKVEEAPKEDTASTEEPTSAKSEEEVSKPKGFTPRFKAGITKTNTNQEHKEEAQDKTESSETIIPKPENPSTNITSKPVGFKPRFGAKKQTDQNDKED